MSDGIIHDGKFDLGQFKLQVAEKIYRPLVTLDIVAWQTSEPVPFNERFSGKEVHLKQGERWGRQLFDCAWFCFSAEIPEASDGELVASIDLNGELCIVDEKGIPVRGLTCKKSVFDQRLGTPGKTKYEIPAHLLNQPKLELWADAGFNDLFGSLPGEGKIEAAELCSRRSDIRDLYYDLEVLADLHAVLAPGESFGEKLLSAAARAKQALNSWEHASVAAARAILRPLFDVSGTSSNLHVSAIGHAHLDLAWLWPIRETIRKGARTFATALYNIERHPDYIFGCSQAQLFAWMKEGYPELYQRIKQAVKAGRIEIQGTFWVEPDCNLPSGEALVRQIIYGARFFRAEFGIVPRFCWEPDVFGYSGQLPQILKKSGHEYFMTQKLSWNIVNRFPHHSFHWEGIDGSTILAHMLSEETYNGPAAPHSLRKINNDYAQRDVSNHALMVFGIGDGGGGPDAEHLERLRRTEHLADLPQVRQRKAVDFFELWAAEAAAFPVWKGELYLERHQGTLTTQARTKRHNRLCEISLREAEWACALAEILAHRDYPQAQLDRLWEEVLLYQFHDILPGSSIKRVYDEARPRYESILDTLESLISERYAAIAQLVKCDRAPLVFNSLPWRREEWLKVEGEWRFAQVAGMGYSTLGERGLSTELRAEDNSIENENLRVVFGDDGSLSSIFDKQNSGEVLAPNEAGNEFVVFDDRGDAWDFETNFGAKDVWVYLRQQPDKLTFVGRKAYVDGPCAVMEQNFSYGASTINQRVILKAGAVILEFETHVNWAEPRKMLRVKFPVAVESSQARFEIPFGSLARSTAEETLVQKAQIEVAGHQWIDLSEDTHGVALINDCKYGFRVKGHTLDMNLIRSVPFPNVALVGKDDQAKGAETSVFTDLGEHYFRYALLPHSGRISEAELTRLARAFNIPLRIVPQVSSGKGDLPAQRSFLHVGNPAIDIAAVKKAEDGMGWIIRLVNVMPSAQESKITLDFDTARIEETDLLEVPWGGALPLEPSNTTSLTFTKFEIKTLRCIFV